MTEDNEYKEPDFRNVVFYIFFFNFLIGLLVSIVGLFILPWNLLGNSALLFAGVFIYIMILNICFLAVVYWVSEDGKLIREFDDSIMELKQRLLKLESK